MFSKKWEQSVLPSGFVFVQFVLPEKAIDFLQNIFVIYYMMKYGLKIVGNSFSLNIY